MPRLTRVLPWAILILLGACSNGRGNLEEATPSPSSPPPTSNAQDTFTIGGAVSGLLGSGLVLQMNGGNDVAISSDGSFTFDSRLPSGGEFAVTVQSQPTAPAQSCTVTSGTGVVATSNVSNITVACARGQYSVGGNVTGLVGGGLILQNNGVDDLAIDTNGTFAFTTALADGQAYNVAVRSQPAGQNCFVRNAAGTVTANVTNVELSCVGNRVPIGGEVRGLSGSGLVLALNGGEDLAIASNGRFAFESGLALGSAYVVSVATSPKAPTQRCEITNARGTALSEVTNVLVTCTTAQFTVGGSVSGLATSGLRLSLNGANELAIAADGAFSFSPPLPSGAAYAVTVSAQPANRLCSVANGTGTVGAADIANVRVTCASNVYSIRGSVNGLLGRGLVLQNNGGDPVGIDGNGAFAFPTELASGSIYNVTVQTQPSAPTQTCSVSNGRGSVANTAISNIVVSCSTSDFTIGGTVRQLTGSGLVLRNNGVDELRIDTAGTFTFDGALPDGSTYNVTIVEQPRDPNQTCSITNGAGTVRSANVTSVSVECSTGSTGFLIGGEVSDLRGAGLVLQNNGLETLQIASNGRFNFTTRVPSGSFYDVTVARQPTNPNQRCTVKHAWGIVLASSIRNVEVKCRGGGGNDDDDDDEDAQEDD